MSSSNEQESSRRMRSGYARRKWLQDFWKENKIEILAGLVALIGLLVFTLGRTNLMALFRTIPEIAEVVETTAGRIRPTDAIGLVVGIGAVLFVIWRIRVRYLASPRWRVDVCPKCKSPIRRSHRTALDRIASAIVLPHARRYKCTSPTCTWQGLLRHTSHHHDQGK